MLLTVRQVANITKWERQFHWEKGEGILLKLFFTAKLLNGNLFGISVGAELAE